MNENDIRDDYFEWLYNIVCDDENSKHVSYRKLLNDIHAIPFRYSIAMDSNRAADGVDLRYRYGYEHGIDQRIIASCLDICPCSVLEMMIALALRMEESIMADSDYGNRTGQWFWNMIGSLHLGSQSDDHYNAKKVMNIILRFLDRDYDYNGNGGLFTLSDPTTDQRETEIWYQMCGYLSEIQQ